MYYVIVTINIVISKLNYHLLLTNIKYHFDDKDEKKNDI